MTVIPNTHAPDDDVAIEPAPSPHETSGPPVAGDVESFPSHAELARTLVADGGVATLSTLTPSGHPYASIAPISVRADGAALICVSDLAEHTREPATGSPRQPARRRTADR